MIPVNKFKLLTSDRKILLNALKKIGYHLLVQRLKNLKINLKNLLEKNIVHQYQVDQLH